MRLSLKLTPLITHHIISMYSLAGGLWLVDIAEQESLEKQEREWIATLLQVPQETIVDDILYWMMGENESAIRQYWVEKPWEQRPMSKHSADVEALIKLGETVWLLERNAAAAGVMRVEDYLTWRSEQEGLC